jgi:hypothetical protein
VARPPRLTAGVGQTANVRFLSPYATWALGIGLASLTACATVYPIEADYPALAPGAPCATEGFISRGCGASIGIFEGTVTGRFQDGSKRPLPHARFFLADGSDKPLEPVDIPISKRGRFHVRAGVDYSVQKSCHNGVIEEEEIFGHQIFAVQADGCREERVTYDNTDHVYDIELDCSLSP